MARIIPIQALFAVLAAYSYPALAETSYSKTVELPPLRISFSELQAVLNKGVSLVTAASGSAPWREEMELRKGELRVRVTGHRLNPDELKLPDSVDSFQYTASTGGSAAITNLAMDFTDYKRTLLVSGQIPEQVDAVFSALREDLLKLSTPIGGSVLKNTLGLTAIWLLVGALIWLGATWLQTHRRTLQLPIAICAALLSTILLLPTGDLLAGFSAVRGDASFMVRYGSEISFWGLVLAVVLAPLSFIPLFSRAVPKTKATTKTPRRAQTQRRSP